MRATRSGSLRLVAAAATLLAAGAAWSLPDNPKNPPLPPTAFGNLYERGRLHLRSCQIVSRDDSRGVISFWTNHAKAQVSYWRRNGTWSPWTDVAGTSYTCTAPQCLWGQAQVRLRGCTSGTCDPPGCTVSMGVRPGGPPAVSPAGLPVPSISAAGCAQTGHTELTFEARWVGAPASGYPQAEDDNGNALALTQLSRATIDGVETGTYTAPITAGLVDGDSFVFDFSLAANRTTRSTVWIRDHCLAPPIVQQVVGGVNRLDLANGQQVQSAANLELAVVTGNSAVSLTSHQLTPTQAFNTPFAGPTVNPNNSVTLAWSETGNGWDGRTYTSPNGAVEVIGRPCVTSGARYWITGLADIVLAEDTNWTDGPLVETDACAPSSPGAPVVSNELGVLTDWQAVAEGAGWRVQVRAQQNVGLVASDATYQGGLWGSAQNLRALRPAPGSCPSGERLISGVCQPCPDYRVCSGGSLVTQQWCSAGNPPADSSMASYQACVAGTTQTVQTCIAAGVTPPADAPCPTCAPGEHAVERAGVWVCEPLSCPPGEYAHNGTCHACTDYEACVGGVQTTQQWCQAGTVPIDATTVAHQDCIGGTTQTVQTCVGPGDPTPTNFICPPAPTCAATEVAEWDDNTDVWVCNPLSCPPGERPVAGVCQTCPDYQVCSGGSLVTQQWCSAGSPPADATTANYQACVGGSLTTQTACLNPGQSVPADATTASQQWCDAGTTRTRTVCVDAGDIPPADAPCTTCPSGQRLVAGTCQTCPDYQVCSSGSLATQQWCSAGNPPADAQIVSFQWCDSGTTRSSSGCYGPSDTLPSDAPCPPQPTCAPGERPVWDPLAYNWACQGCPSGQRLVGGVCQTCPTYEACSGNSLVTRQWCSAGNPPADATTANYQVCSGNSLVTRTACLDPGDSTPASATTASVQYCDSGTTRTRTECVDAGDSPSADAPCTSCPSGQRLVGLNCEPCPDYQVCSGNSLSTQEWCGSGSPPTDAYTVSRQWCDSGTTRTRTVCVAGGGSAPANDPCPPRPSCSCGTAYWSGSSWRCPSTTSYRYCNGNSLATGQWCVPDDGPAPADARVVSYAICSGNALSNRSACVDAGDSAPASAWINTYQVCSGGTLSSRTECLDPGDSATADDTVGTETYCGGSRTICGSDTDSRSATERYCQGSSSRSRTVYGTCTDEDNRSATRWYCQGSQSRSTTIYNTCLDDDDRSATRHTCGGGTTIYGTCTDEQVYEATEWYCQGGSSRTRTISGTCTDNDTRSGTERYCQGSSSRTRTVSGICGTEDNRTATRYYCSGSSLQTTTLYGTCTDDDDRPSSCGSGYVMNSSGCCEPCSAVDTYCGGTRPISGCTDTDSREATETYCSGGSTRTRTIYGTCTDRDVRAATRYSCSGSSLQTSTLTGTCTDEDDRPSNCSSGYELNSDGCCEACSSTETYCVGSSTRTRSISGCADVDSRSATRTYCDSNANAQTTTITACVDEDDRPSSCPSGSSMNGDGCCEEDIDEPACVKPPRPACSPDGQSWSWNETDCQWDSESVSMPPCSRTVWNNGAMWMYVYSDCSASHWSELSCSWIMVYGGTETAVPLQ